MNAADAYAGTSFPFNSAGPVNSFVLTPGEVIDPATNAPPSAKALRIVVTAYKIYQASNGTASCVAFFDATAAPAYGRNMWLGNATDPKFVYPLAPGGAIWQSLSPPWDFYEKGLVLVASTSLTQLLAPNSQVVFQGRYAWGTLGGFGLGGRVTN